MKKTLSFLLALCLVIGLMPLTAHAEEVASGTCGENLTWVLDDEGKLTISGEGIMGGYFEMEGFYGFYSSQDAPWYDVREQIITVVIEAGVTTIGRNAFNGYSSLRNVYIPETVEIIEDHEFLKCGSLTGIWVDEANSTYCSDTQGILFTKDQTELIQAPAGLAGDYYIPDGVISVSDSAFINCSMLENLYIPGSVRNLSIDAIYSVNGTSCGNLMGLWVDEENENYSSDESGILFDKEKTELIRMPGGFSGTYTVPDGVANLGANSFAGCKSLIGITISDSVSTVGVSAFYNCSSLSDVNLGRGIEQIKYNAFCECTSVSSITFWDSVVIYNEAFRGDTALSEIIFVGDAPGFYTQDGEFYFQEVVADCFYPADNETWTKDILKNYGGTLTWIPYTPGEEPIDPEPTEPVPTDPEPTEPTPTDPEPTEPEPTDPEPTEPTPTEPEPTEPTPTEPDPTEPDPTEPEITENPFTDVKTTAYYYQPVLWAVGEGVTSGTSATTFGPNNSCTRGQIVTFLWRAAGSPEPESSDNPFTDVSASSYYYKAVLWAVENGITGGTSATTFSPNNPCTRGQVVTFLWAAKGRPEPESTSNAFSDVKASDYYYKAVLWAVENGITSGIGNGKFGPGNTCTRGQIVTFLYKAFA